MVKRKSHSALVQALLIQDEAEIKRILFAADNLNEADSSGWTPLMAASAKSPLTIVRAIVDAAGTDVNKGDLDGFTPLMCAAGEGRTEIVKFLIQKGAIVDFADTYGRTGLSWAVTKGDFDETAEAFIQTGADVSKSDIGGFTPLMRSALMNHLRCFEALVRHGANIDAVHPEWRKSALDMALERGSDALKEVVRKLRS